MRNAPFCQSCGDNEAEVAGSLSQLPIVLKLPALSAYRIQASCPALLADFGHLQVEVTFTDPGATVTDNVDTGLTATVTGTVDTNVVGSYTLTYNAIDTAGNAAAPVTRTVNVTDQTAPVITPNGANPLTVIQGSAFTDPGAMVTDNVDTGFIASVTGTVDTAMIGTYTLSYDVIDAAGNAAITVTRTVDVI